MDRYMPPPYSQRLADAIQQAYRPPPSPRSVSPRGVRHSVSPSRSGRYSPISTITSASAETPSLEDKLLREYETLTRTFVLIISGQDSAVVSFKRVSEPASETPQFTTEVDLLAYQAISMRLREFDENNKRVQLYPEIVLPNGIWQFYGYHDEDTKHSQTWEVTSVRTKRLCYVDLEAFKVRIEPSRNVTPVPRY